MNPKPETTQMIQIQFPLAGIDSGDPVSFQRPLTTRDCLNVRAIESLTQRARGGRRPGLTQFIRQALPTVDDPLP